MKAGYCLPSGNYNIVLSEDELSQLLKTGHVTIHMSRVPCTTSRLVFNDDEGKMEIHDKKPIYNNLFFHVNEPVADIEAGDHNVQFLCINIERKTGSDIDGSDKNQNGTDGHLEL